jgi:hypothetical protein
MARRQSLERTGGNPRLVARRTVSSGGSEERPAVSVAETPLRQPVQGPAGLLRVAWDDDNLRVSVKVPVTHPDALDRGEVWGSSDGAEISLRDASRSPPGPTCILRGFVTGKLVVSHDAGMHPEDIHRVESAARYTASAGRDGWTGEWVIPFPSLDLNARPGLEIGFNCAVRRSADGQWLVWAGTTGAAWLLDGAGVLVLE